MTILVFTEGTILVFLSGKNVPREKVVRLSQIAARMKILENMKAAIAIPRTSLPKGAVYDFVSYIPIGSAVEKLTSWKKQGATIYYLSSRQVKEEINAIKNVLQTYRFPDCQNLSYRKQGEDYKDVAEKLMPDILIEDDCESIGGEKEMTYTHMRDDAKARVHSVTIKEFSGIDDLPDSLSQLKTY